jgi:hypothetical protein
MTQKKKKENEVQIIKKEEVAEMLSSGKLGRVAILIGLTAPNGNLEDISDKLIQLEERLTKAIKEADVGEYASCGKFDGGQIPLLFFAPDGTKLLKVVYPILRESEFKFEDLPI